MSHKADKEFFRTKRIWSKRKDAILGYYLVPYLPKVASQRKPILIVDGFAGPGAFMDGAPGSPLIIRGAIEKAQQSRNPPDVKCLFVERDPELFEQLRERFRGDGVVETLCGSFLSAIDRIEALVPTHSVLLYLDPYTVDGLDWEALDRIFRHVNHGDHSIEVLLNFNVHSFGRRGLAALRLAVPQEADSGGDEEHGEPSSIARLNEIVGGAWWQEILGAGSPYPDRLAQVTEHFCEQLAVRFAEVCTHEVRASVTSRVPKYIIVFASRHPDTRELMNDAMVKSLSMLADECEPDEATLFETRPEALVPDLSRISGLVLRSLETKMSRKQLIRRMLGDTFGVYPSGEMKKSIGELVKTGQIKTNHHNARLNDACLVWKG